MCDKPYFQFFSTHYVIKEDSGLEFSQFFLEGKISNGGEDFEWMVLLIAKPKLRLGSWSYIQTQAIAITFFTN